MLLGVPNQAAWPVGPDGQRKAPPVHLRWAATDGGEDWAKLAALDCPLQPRGTGRALVRDRA